MDFEILLEKKVTRFGELEAEIGSPAFYDQPARAREVMREHARVKEMVDCWSEYKRTKKNLQDNEELQEGDDPELAEMAKLENEELEVRLEELEKQLQILLLPPDPNEDRDAIVEIRAGTGGTEAALFAGDLCRMYQRYVENLGLKVEMLESNVSDLGGYKEVIFKVTGDGVFRHLKYESGVHRVQRVPATEAQGRVHTSTATVAVLPEAEEVDLEIKPDDLRIEVCRAGGPGGQGVNTTDSAVQILHIPTGKIVRCQDGRSQQKNKEKALSILRSRLLEEKQREEEAKYAAQRKKQIGFGGREEKIRTYNYRENRVTDHRILLTLHNLDLFMQGDIQEMIDSLRTADLAEQLEEANLAS